MESIHVGGVDPGLVDTGVVRMVFTPERRHVHVTHKVVKGTDATEVADWLLNPAAVLHRPSVFIEGYRPRSGFATDLRMVGAVRDVRVATGGQVLSNTGVKKVVRRGLMELVGVWSFTTPTHHQDLRSAARIALLGMLKDKHMNVLLADVVRDHLAGDSWSVRT